MALGFGAFHPYAPWTLLHAHAPVFGSQHVPSRFLYPATLILGVVAAAGLGKLVERRAILLPWLEPVLCVLVLGLALDIARVAELPMKDAMWMVPPENLPQNRPFTVVEDPIYQYQRRDWAGPMYLSMIANTGVIRCYGAPPFGGQGAVASSTPRFRGDAFVEGLGVAKVSKWSPNEVTIEVDAVQSGVLVYNMNYDAGFDVRVDNGGHVVSSPAARDQDRLAAVVPEGHSVVTFSYVPVRMRLGLALFAVAVSGLVFAWVLERRRA